jgi:FkbM family methyltransferase
MAESASAPRAGRKAKRQAAPGAKRQAAGAKRRAAPEAKPREGARRPRRRDALDERAALFEQLHDQTPYLGVHSGDADFVVSTADRHIGRGLFVKGQRPEMGVLRRAVEVVQALLGEDALADSMFVDVGANIGTTTVTAVLSHPFAGAVAFEPDAENYRVLQANLVLNRIDDRVEALRVGASNRTGPSRLVVMAGQGGKSWVALEDAEVPAHDAEDGAAQSVVDIELTTLDQLAADGVLAPDRVGMLWVDAEGHEGHVIEGATTLTERGVPIVLEFHPAGIDQRGDRGKVHAVADERYTHFVDVRRAPSEKGQRQLALREATELPDYAERFLSESTPEIFTDVLLLRLTPEQVAAIRRGPGPIQAIR